MSRRSDCGYGGLPCSAKYCTIFDFDTHNRELPGNGVFVSRRLASSE
jgi:hypothetical protein